MGRKPKLEKKLLRRLRRRKRIRAKIFGTKEVPRLSVFRSNKHIYAQIIDDERGVTMVSSSDFNIKDLKKGNENLTKKEIAFKVGESLAKKALKKGIKKVAFDRGGYKYHGRVKSLAEGVRKGGLIF